MPDDNLPRQDVYTALDRIDNLDPKLRDDAFRAVYAHIQYIYATATGGAGPIAVSPGPGGSSTTTGTFKCPSCGHIGTASYT